MSSGPSLMFVSLPKVFASMGAAGPVIGLVFFVMVAFAALTSCISIMETLVANCMEIFHQSRKAMSLTVGVLATAAAVVVCLGYNVFYFELTLPSGATAQILDLMDYISNSFSDAVYLLLNLHLCGMGHQTAVDHRGNGGQRAHLRAQEALRVYDPVCDAGDHGRAVLTVGGCV